MPMIFAVSQLEGDMAVSIHLDIDRGRFSKIQNQQESAIGPECVKTSAKNRAARSCVSSGKSRQAFRPGIHVGTPFLGRFLITLTVVRVLTQSGPKAANRVRLDRSSVRDRMYAD